MLSMPQLQTSTDSVTNEVTHGIFDTN